MIRMPLMWLVGALAAAALAAGCGSSSSTTSSSTTPATPAVTSAAGTPTSTSPAVTGATAAGLAQAVAICKSVVQRAPTLSASVKAKIESICSKAEHGDLAGARAAGKEVCTEIVNASPIPGAAKAQALAACSASTEG